MAISGTLSTAMVAYLTLLGIGGFVTQTMILPATLSVSAATNTDTPFPNGTGNSSFPSSSNVSQQSTTECRPDFDPVLGIWSQTCTPRTTTKDCVLPSGQTVPVCFGTLTNWYVDPMGNLLVVVGILAILGLALLLTGFLTSASSRGALAAIGVGAVLAVFIGTLAGAIAPVFILLDHGTGLGNPLFAIVVLPGVAMSAIMGFQYGAGAGGA